MDRSFYGAEESACDIANFLGEKARLVQLPKLCDRRGNLTFVQNGDGLIPFDLRRVYYLYDVPADEERGGHAHKDLEQLIIAANGSFNVVLNNGAQEKVIHLYKPYVGLYLPKFFWRELKSFSSGALCLVLASQIYEESDYIRSLDEFHRLVGAQK